jgi:hypothetical protein
MLMANTWDRETCKFLYFPPKGFPEPFREVRDGYGEDECESKVVGTERLILNPYL